MPDLKSIEIFQYTAFTDQPFAGNPAGVVTDASALADAEMQSIARQLNLAETAFLLPPSHSGADVRLRWFTPTIEVDLCGHATIAAFAAALEHGIFPVTEGGERILRVETLSGVLRVRLSHQSGRPRIAMQIPLPRFADLDLDRDAFAELWGVASDYLTGEWLRHQALNYWYIPVRDRRVLTALVLDTERLAMLDPKAAFAFYTTDAIDPDSHWHLRFFAPFHGVPEDIVTGSAQGPMGAVHLRGRLSGLEDGWREFKGEQGDLLGRPGRVTVRVLVEEQAVQDLEIAGSAQPMLEGRILL
ncbi:MAG: PhzF family phenazine biosynthesis protein [Gemmatimonadota bacterium]|nr:MAG: PhzF family phenazine biosynthesis protein [Gemmatimonadota bacterium]